MATILFICIPSEIQHTAQKYGLPCPKSKQITENITKLIVRQFYGSKFKLVWQSRKNVSVMQFAYFQHDLKPPGKKTVCVTPLPFGNLSLSDPPIPWNFRDPPWGGMDIFWNHTFHRNYFSTKYREILLKQLLYSFLYNI